MAKSALHERVFQSRKRDSPEAGGIEGVTYVQPPEAERWAGPPGLMLEQSFHSALPLLSGTSQQGAGRFPQGGRESEPGVGVRGLQPLPLSWFSLLSQDLSWPVLSSPPQGAGRLWLLAGQVTPAPRVSKTGPDYSFACSVICSWNQPLSHLPG